MQQVLNPYSPIHKHIEARMNMVRKTAKQFYIKKYSLSDVGIFLFSHLVAKALSSALQGLTSVFGRSGLRKAPLFGERTRDGAIRERIAKSALNEQSPRGRGVDPLRHQHQLLIVTSFGSPSWAFPTTLRLTAACSTD